MKSLRAYPITHALFFIALAISSTGRTSAASEPDYISEEVLGNLHAGSVRVFGSLRLESNSDDRGRSFEFTPGADYFIFDDIAVGWSLGIASQTGRDTVASMGPEGQYEFWKKGRLASYVRAGIQLGLTSATVRQSILGELGAQYFLTPSVEVGPYFRYNRFFSSYSDWNRVSFGAFLGIYL